MDDELKKRIIDYFDGYELVEFLNISIEDIVEAFPEIIEDNLEMLEDYLKYGR